MVPIGTLPKNGDPLGHTASGSVNIEHNNGDGDCNDGQADEHDKYCDHVHKY